MTNTVYQDSFETTIEICVGQTCIDYPIEVSFQTYADEIEIVRITIENEEGRDIGFPFLLKVDKALFPVIEQYLEECKVAKAEAIAEAEYEDRLYKEFVGNAEY